MFRSTIIVAAILGGSASFAIAGELKAKKDTEVFAEANKKGQSLAKIAMGENVEETGRAGMFWKVKLKDGRTGFASVMDLTRSAGGADGVASALRDAVQQGRSLDDASNVRNRSAVMGVRGLDESSDTAFAGNVRPNIRLVYSMENILISAADVDAVRNQVEKDITQKLQTKK